VQLDPGASVSRESGANRRREPSRFDPRLTKRYRRRRIRMNEPGESRSFERAHPHHRSAAMSGFVAVDLYPLPRPSLVKQRVSTCKTPHLRREQVGRVFRSPIWRCRGLGHVISVRTCCSSILPVFAGHIVRLRHDAVGDDPRAEGARVEPGGVRRVSNESRQDHGFV